MTKQLNHISDFKMHETGRRPSFFRQIIKCKKLCPQNSITFLTLKNEKNRKETNARIICMVKTVLTIVNLSIYEVKFLF